MHIQGGVDSDSARILRQAGSGRVVVALKVDKKTIDKVSFLPWLSCFCLALDLNIPKTFSQDSIAVETKPYLAFLSTC